MQKVIKACLGVLIKNDRVLIASRPEGKVMAGYWEFPGGKIEDGETVYDTIHRELLEEIGITSDVQSFINIGKVKHLYPHGLAELDVILIQSWHGEPVPCEGQQLYWCDLSNCIDVEPLLPTTVEVFNLLSNYLSNK